MGQIKIKLEDYNKLVKRSYPGWIYPITLSVDIDGLMFFSKSKGRNKHRKAMDYVDFKEFPFLKKVLLKNPDHKRFHITKNKIFLADGKKLLYKVVII